jgi:hypothetical protein
VEPIFQDGIIAQAVDIVVAAQDVAFFSSAGNRARTSWEEPTDFVQSTLAVYCFINLAHAAKEIQSFFNVWQ